jgi:hypothetical protein
MNDIYTTLFQQEVKKTEKENQYCLSRTRESRYFGRWNFRLTRKDKTLRIIYE